MTKRGWIGTVSVAVDHSDATLTRYLAGVTDARPQSQDIRRLLAGAAVAGEADGLVICPEDADWAAGQFSTIALTLGLPDVRAGDDVLSMFDAALSNVQLPVKLGLPFGRSDLWRPVSIVESIQRHRPNVCLIIEPYFGADVGLADRSHVLRELTAFDIVSAFKLDVESPERNADTYTQSTRNVPWLARSDGLDYQVFARRIKVAVSMGCSGVIAGAAIWRSELRSVVFRHSNESLIRVLIARIGELRDLCLARGS